jgi:transcriptional regulator with XRE-family HTH domain
MKQPELGKKLNEIRNQKGITQKELSDLCSVDIRTIQRIEAGEVEPRMSTVKILAAALENDELISNQNVSNINNVQLKRTLLVSFISGIFYFFNFILYSVVVPNFTSISGGPVLFLLSMIHVISGGLFFMGFIMTGWNYKNKLLLITSISIIILIALFVIVDMLARISGNQVFGYFVRGVVLLMGFGGVLFGVGLLKAGTPGKVWFLVAGILQIVQNIMFLIPLLPVQYIGLWLAVPANFILLLVLYFEWKETDLL